MKRIVPLALGLLDGWIAHLIAGLHDRRRDLMNQPARGFQRMFRPHPYGLTA